MKEVSYNFSDETVIITGGSSGIGRGIALKFGRAGATVINADVREEPKAYDIPTHKVIENEGGSASFVETDVTSIDDLQAVVDHAEDYGGLDIMVNNAGIFLEGSIRETSPEEFDQLFSVNMRGVFFGCQVAANRMIENGDEGVIVNTASIGSDLAQHDHVQYDSTKAGVKMITRGAAFELAEHNIRVNAVAPGTIPTEIIEGYSGWGQEELSDLIKPIPLGRVGTPEDIADTTLFLASDAADYITGETVYVDGGWQIF